MTLYTLTGYCVVLLLAALSIFWLTGRAARFALSWSRRRAMRALIMERQSAFLPPNPARERAKEALTLGPLPCIVDDCRNERRPNSGLCATHGAPPRELSNAVPVPADISGGKFVTMDELRAAASGLVITGTAHAAHDGLSYLSDWASGVVTASNGTTSTTLTGAALGYGDCVECGVSLATGIGWHHGVSPGKACCRRCYNAAGVVHKCDGCDGSAGWEAKRRAERSA